MDQQEVILLRNAKAYHRLVWAHKFRGGNFCGWLHNWEIRERFLLQRFSAIEYMDVGCTTITLYFDGTVVIHSPSHKLINF